MAFATTTFTPDPITIDGTTYPGPEQVWEDYFGGWGVSVRQALANSDGDAESAAQECAEAAQHEHGLTDEDTGTLHDTILPLLVREA